MYFKTPESALNWLTTNWDSVPTTLPTNLAISILSKYSPNDITNEIDQKNSTTLNINTSIFNEIIASEQTLETYVMTKYDLIKILNKIKKDDHQCFMALKKYMKGGFFDALNICKQFKYRLKKFGTPLRLYLDFMEQFSVLLGDNEYMLNSDVKCYCIIVEPIYKKLVRGEVQQHKSKKTPTSLGGR